MTCVGRTDPSSSVGGADERPAGARVDVRDVFHIYRDADVETVALRGIDLRVEPGEYVALMGRSGSGKSTLLNLMAATDRPSAGAILVDGLDLAAAGEPERLKLRGRTVQHISQAGNLVEFLDLQENVQLAAELAGVGVRPTDAAAALDRVGLSGAARRRPAALSGGEQQRAALAIVLATKPRLVLADELTGELDRATAAAILDAVDDMRNSTGVTIVAATHDPAVAARADRVVEIADGRLRSRSGADVPPPSAPAPAGASDATGHAVAPGPPEGTER